MITTATVLLRPPAITQRPALLSFAAAALAAALLTMVYLHAISIAELSPVSTTVSDLIFVDRMGWLFGVSTGLLAAASVALTVALARTRLPGSTPVIAALSLWCLGLIVAGTFPTDPIGVETLSLAGEIHRYAGASMYLSLPVAGWLVHLRSRSVASWDPYRGAVRAMSLASATVGVLFLLSSAPSLFPGSPLADLFDDHLIHGLVERVLILCLFGLLVAIGAGASAGGRAGVGVGLGRAAWIAGSGADRALATPRASTRDRLTAQPAQGMPA